MKIGFSFGRCIRDIVNGEINIDDVAFLITATRIRDESHRLASLVTTWKNPHI